MWSRASAAQVADWPQLAEAQGGPRRALALREASGEPAGRSVSHLVFDIGGGALMELAHVSLRAAHPQRCRRCGGLGGGRDELYLTEGRESSPLGEA